ncbi:1,4-dihydroxy-2-naphthoate polyprenyltransferase [Aestuariimicrobium ganziense]|uniref:1,4-dihydroxy-2-naphthoate polyprenyltransferase n=1 Tax=Aestuariimicrobium ganziense TaxID=2773677 RepID=UPI0019405504|nr:1,4-dihydroxy-2-naphthoate polyprenyltransferase [Aestuariimicrobium ganziense]
MATIAEWVEGARPRTLPAAVSPVLAGSATALVALGRFESRHVVVAALCAVIALALQIGVNFANDHSDGVRGTDDERIGPMRLVGSGAATPSTVKAAAFTCFGIAAVAGLVAVWMTGLWWLLAVGAAAILAAWFYTGGRHPYGYLGLGEVFVFIFFGLVAVAGTHLLLTRSTSIAAWMLAVAIGLIACLILVANNLRDIEGDTASGKRTLATRIGDPGSRTLFMVMARFTLFFVVIAAATSHPWLLLGMVGGIPLMLANATVSRGATGRELIGVLKLTGIAELLVGLGVLFGAVLAVA